MAQNFRDYDFRKYEYRTFNRQSNARKYIEYNKALKNPKKRQQRRSNSYVGNSLERARQNQQLSGNFKELNRTSTKISNTCNDLLKGIETLFKATLLLAVGIYAVRSYLDGKESIFNSFYAPSADDDYGLSSGHMSEEGKRKLKEHEGLRLEAYDLEGKGVYTIGYGHYGKVDGKPIYKGQTITKEKAEELFEQDVAAKEKLVRDQLKANGITTPISQKQFDAMVNYAFMHRLGPKFLAKLKAKDYLGAAEELDFDKGMKNNARMQYLQQLFKHDVTADNKLKDEVFNPVVKETSAGKIRRFSNNTMVGGYKMYNPSDKRNYILLSDRAAAYLKETGGSGIVTSGAEGDHALGTLSHSTGNKIDVQGMKGAGTTNAEYAALCIKFLKNKKTAYVNLESFSNADVNEVVNYIKTHDSEAYKRAYSPTPYSPSSKTWFNKGRLLCSVYIAKNPKHLDIGILPDAYSEHEAKKAPELKEESKNTKKVETNNQVTEKPTQNSTQPKTENKSTSPTALNLNSTSKAPSNLKNTNIAEPVENIKQTKKSYRKARK